MNDIIYSFDKDKIKDKIIELFKKYQNSLNTYNANGNLVQK